MSRESRENYYVRERKKQHRFHHIFLILLEDKEYNLKYIHLERVCG